MVQNVVGLHAQSKFELFRDIEGAAHRNVQIELARRPINISALPAVLSLLLRSHGSHL